MSLPKKSRKQKDFKKQKQTRTQTRKHTHKRNSGSNLQYLPASKHVKPGDNFYTYINEKWLHKTHIPPTKSAFGVSEEVENRIDTQTKLLMNDCIAVSKSHKKDPTYMESLESLLGTLASSVLTADTQKHNVETVHSVLSEIRSLQSKEEVAVVMGELSRYKIRGLFSMYGQYENKNKTLYTFTIGTGGLGLPDPSYYYKKSLHRGAYFSLYKHMVKQLEHIFQIPNLSCVIKLERILAGVLLRTERDTIEHERTGSQLEEEFQHIPFSVLFETIGLANWKPRIFYIESLRWLHTINKLFHHLGLDYWRLLLSYQFILFALPWLPPPYSDVSFHFYRQQLRGQDKKVPRTVQALDVLQQYATPFFSRLYVERIMNKDVKPKIVSMVKDFLTIGEKRLATVEWLEPQTRKKAQEKIQKMRYIVAYPDSFEHHTFPSLDPENCIYNLLQLGQWRTEYEIKKLGQPITQRKEWDDALFVVNAYYYGQANEMVIPSGILQDPFYNESRSVAWNYGGLGCILCHEMTHAFDNEGKDYDPQGFQKRWWTRSDNRNYNKQTKALVELYSKQRVYGFPVSGQRTLSENIADIGGMGIALDALHQKLDTLKLTGAERHQYYRDFFTSYAVSWRLKDKQKKRMQALIVDKHAPAFLRVNLVVSQFQEWYDAFEIQPGDSLYTPPEKRIRIF